MNVVLTVDAPPGATAGDPALGLTLEGRYRITHFIGSGGMGSVYAASDLVTGERVAVKLITRAGKSVADLERFRREGRAAARVTHENVVHVIGVGAVANYEFLVMEHIEGVDLARLLARGRIAAPRAIAIVRQLLLGLHAIHRAGIVHRDIKPANVLITRGDGGADLVKLVDFGIAWSAEDTLDLTATGLVVGTPQFMAPERFVGGEATPLADLYSVGVLLYTMLAGAPPFSAPTGQRLAAMHMSDAPAPIRAVGPELPQALEAVVARALAKRPEDRFHDALAFAAAIDSVRFPELVEATTIDEARHRSRGPATLRRLALGPGRSVDRFELIRELGRGGMGQVFLARDTRLGRRVAIKFLLHEEPSFVQRFLVEARATARCTHENIVTIHDVGEHEGLPYMVLEYLEGPTMLEVLKTSQPSHRQVIELVIPVVRALVRAHEHGIVHRDLKPSNISVTNRGAVKVLDFGVARMMNLEENARRSAMMAAIPESGQLTRADALVGTLQYMSPEQWRSEGVDQLSDIWAIGIIFWRALAGVHPAGNMSPENLARQLGALDTPFPSLATAVPSASRELALIVDRCLAKRKSHRYQRADELLHDLQQLITNTTETEIEQCPYRGLAAFGEADARFFFGRTNETRTALAQLDAWPFLAVVGPSGAGKSSFVHGGLIPAIHASGMWRVHSVRPGRDPLLRLAAILEDTSGEAHTAAGLVSSVRDTPGYFGAALRRIAARRGERILIVVDQLEELFTLCDSIAARTQFLAALFAAADDPSSPIRVIVSMRADFLDRLGAYPELLAELSRGMFFLSTPDAVNLRETLVRPAELAGYAFEYQWIVDDMMQVASSRGALPLLSFAATRLWDARDRQQRVLTATAYEGMGRVAGAFARHADEVAASVPPSAQRLLRAIFARLVTSELTRATVDLRELLSFSDDAREVERILDKLVAGRLIHVHVDPTEGTTVELVHEMLITEWPALRRFLDDNNAMRGFVQEVRQAAHQWDGRGRPADLVWRGATAQEALANARKYVLPLSAVEREFVAEIAREASRARRRRRLVLAGVATALALVVAGGGIAVMRIRHAEHEASNRAAAANAALASEQRAKDALQDKLEVIEATRAAREAAERDRLSEEMKRHDAEAQAAAAKGEVELSREQLEQVNRELRRKVVETQAAKEAAVAAENATETLLAKERAERERLERERKLIDERKLQ